ncbi:MAG: hypothetical protein JSS56_20150, partial [Proteobacteria bacterium]|nr:hypothetical protein [Pseudomonadota bacterium]
MRTGIRWDRVLAGVSRLSTLASPGIALLALLWAGTAIAAEFHCADLKPSDVDKPPYERISGQMRCEGFYIKNVSQPFIELVSLTASTPS